MTRSGATPRVRVREVVLAERPLRLRIPFRFGRITLTDASQLFVRVRVDSGRGRGAWGSAAELLVPKWFDKDPARGDAQNVDDLRSSVSAARDACQRDDPMSAFELSRTTLAQTRADARLAGLPSLVIGYGPALIDRAVIDALGRALGASFFELVADNRLGFDAGVLDEQLSDLDSARFLASLDAPHEVYARHTVGFTDPLSRACERVADGLPVTLAEVIEVYGNCYFKLKLGGEVDADVARLEAIAEVLDAHAASDYRVTLDGNELYPGVGELCALIDAIDRSPRLVDLRAAMLWLEQPLPRAMALDCDVSAIARRLALIIDESDDGVEAFPRARRCGYAGVSTKQCKGLYKSLLNRARVARWNEHEGSPRYLMSAEDLSCQPGMCVQQDLALAAVLGIRHVERNGHHFGGGLPRGEESRRFLDAHPGLYRELDGRAVLAIEQGRLDLRSLFVEGFAVAAEPVWDRMQPFAEPSREPMS